MQLTFQLFSSDNFGFGFGQSPFIVNNCSWSDCYITDNKLLLPEITDFDMLIFHSANIKDDQVGEFELGQCLSGMLEPLACLAAVLGLEIVQIHESPAVYRSPEQLYVYFSHESPIYDNLNGFENRFQSFFNLTMTYRRDSDFVVPYGETIRRKKPEESEGKINLKEMNASRIDDRKMIAWVVSHCQTNSQREKYVEELRKWIPVDQYGKCSENECDDNCYGNLGAQYKFYLSFENSLCKDYITEKFWNALGQEMVPVVLGAGDYNNAAPPNSFINTQDFKSPKELAHYLLKLDKNVEEYNKYLDWKTTYAIKSNLFPTIGEKLCELCARVHKQENKVYSNFGDWWEKDVCSSPTWNEDDS